MLSIYSDEYQKTVLSGKHPRILLFLFFFVVSVITTIACGYTREDATGNVLLLFLLLLLARGNTLTSITTCYFLCCALYAPAGMTYGKINNSFIVALLQTTTDEAAEFTGMIPVYHFLVSAGDSGIHGDFLANTPPWSP